jgi:hypothetical protein
LSIEFVQHGVINEQDAWSQTDIALGLVPQRLWTRLVTVQQSVDGIMRRGLVAG